MNNAVTTVSICLLLLCSASGELVEEKEGYLRFPPNFLIGAATSSYQIEGAWNVSDKGESSWDRFTHAQKGRIFGDQNGDVACDSYHKFREDVAILKSIGLKAYRFSISWPRVLPTGFSNQISSDGVAYYKALVDELVANDIQPLATLYHWDHPQMIEEAGGWLNPQMVDWFGDYARVIFQELGHKVKMFITINEPQVLCTNSYVSGKHAPGKKNLHGIGEYMCAQNILKAHARAYHIYQDEFKKQHHGSVGLNVNSMVFYPKHAGDTTSAEIAFQFTTGWLLNPIYNGDYPAIMKTMISDMSRGQGYSWSRLPKLEPEWIEYIKGTSDFLALNHYTSMLIEPGFTGPVPSIENDSGLSKSQDPSWKGSNSTWLKVVPKGFGDILRTLANKYRNPTIYITENGVSDATELCDVDRIQYFQGYVKEMLLAINRDGVNVKGYLLWSLLDNFEWARGYSERFGIVHVDFKDPSRKRTLKKSAHWWKRVIENGKLDTTTNEILQRDIVDDLCPDFGLKFM
ncbi:hypothetical protein KM043_005138 [Ampulex compressa]|nr:hypothetical protein KM043_005138 [Ampulex compressa]